MLFHVVECYFFPCVKYTKNNIKIFLIISFLNIRFRRNLKKICGWASDFNTQPQEAQ